MLAAAATAALLFTNRFVVSRGAPTTVGEEVDAIMSETCAGVRHGAAASMSATVPVTCGVAMLVPLHAAYAPAELSAL